MNANDMEKTIEIPFGAKDSELKGWEYTIPEDMEAEIKDGKIIVKKKESEDERIMKEIVDFIYWAIGRGSITNEQRERSDSWLAYLEKKKEQKPESCDCSRDEESYTNGIHHVLMNPETYGLIKQKPAEWRDTDMNEARNNLISVCRDWERGEHTTLLPVAAVHARYFLEHLTEPKPAEWSDGDEGMLNCIIATLCEESHGGRESNDKMVTWLENRLKSLRPQPHWKPSEEQMEALENVIKCELSSGLHARAEILQTLWNDFKKL